MRKETTREVVETNLGLYVWQMPNGKPVGDGEGNFLNIPAKKGDAKRIAILQKAAYEVLKSNGVPEAGEPFFMPGSRRVTDEEHEEQTSRLKSGLIPDEYDVAAMKDQLAAERKFQR